MKKEILLIAWDREASDKAEEGKLPVKKFIKKEFATRIEMAAYIEGVNDGNGWDRPFLIEESKYKFKK